MKEVKRMADKYRIMDTPKSWRLRNGVEVPAEYLNALSKNNTQVGVVVAVLVFLSVLFGTII